MYLRGAEEKAPTPGAALWSAQRRSSAVNCRRWCSGSDGTVSRADPMTYPQRRLLTHPADDFFLCRELVVVVVVVVVVPNSSSPIWRRVMDRVPAGLLQLNSLTFQVVEWQFPSPHRNNSPITQIRNGTLYSKVYNNYETCHLWSNIKCS